MQKTHVPGPRGVIRTRPAGRSVARLLAVTMLASSAALGSSQTDKPQDPVKLKQALTRQRVGNHVEVTEQNAATPIAGVVTAVHDTSFEVTPKGGQAVTVPYAQVTAIHGGMSHRAKVWTWVAVGAVVWVVIAIVAAHTT